mgnify:CR=1 FL=1
MLRNHIHQARPGILQAVHIYHMDLRNETSRYNMRHNLRSIHIRNYHNRT